MDGLPGFVDELLPSIILSHDPPVLVIIQNYLVLTIPTGVTPPPYTRKITVTWLGTVIVLNVALTSMIVIMLWPARRLTASVIGIVVESEAAYTIVGVFYFTSMATGSIYGTLFLQLFGISAVRIK